VRRLAVQKRTVFGDAPCLKLSVDGYIAQGRRCHGVQAQLAPENVSDFVRSLAGSINGKQI